MAYVINIYSDIERKFERGEWINRTWEVVSSEDHKLLRMYEWAGMGGGNFQQLNFAEKMKMVKKPSVLKELSREFLPKSSSVHVLQCSTSNEDVSKLSHIAPDLVVIQDQFNYFLGQLSLENLTEQIAYAYMLIDKCVPECFETPKGYGLRSAKKHWISEKAYSELINFREKQ